MIHPPCGCQHCQQPSAPYPSSCPPKRYRPCPPTPPCPPPRPPKPCKPPKSGGVLLPKIVACERRMIPRLCARLAPENLPDCLCSPFSLTNLRPGCSQPLWSVDKHQPGCGRVSLSITIPLCAQLCDSSGKTVPVSGDVQTEIWLPSHCLNDNRTHLMILPGVRLLCADPDCNGEFFNVQFQLSLEVYVLRFEPCLLHSPEVACPDLPLYPPPADPCAWPAR